MLVSCMSCGLRIETISYIIQPCAKFTEGKILFLDLQNLVKNE